MQYLITLWGLPYRCCKNTLLGGHAKADKMAKLLKLNANIVIYLAKYKKTQHFGAVKYTDHAGAREVRQGTCPFCVCGVEGSLRVMTFSSGLQAGESEAWSGRGGSVRRFNCG